MALSRGLALLLTFAVALPSIAFGADLLQRQVEAVDLTTPLTAGSVYRYDVTALSDPGLLTALTEEAVEIRVGKHEANITIETERRPTHWDSLTRPSQFGLRVPDAAAFTVHETETVSVAGDALSRVAKFQDRQTLSGGEGATDHVWKGSRWAGPAASAGLVSRLADWLGEPARYAPGMDATEPGAYPVRATFEGRTVYGRAEQWTAEHPAGTTPFTCPIDVPPVSYDEPRAAARWSTTAFTVIVDRLVWRAEGVALPVLVDCHATFLADGHDDVGHIHILARLAASQAGHEEIFLVPPLEPDQGDLEASRVPVLGVPPDGHAEAALRFPLAAAWAAVLESEDPRLEDARADGPMPFVLLEAYHEPGVPWLSCAAAVPVLSPRCGLLAEETGREVGFVEPTWWLLLQCEDGTRIAVEVVRNMTLTGQVVEDAVVDVTFLTRIAPVPHDALPQYLVPVNVAFSAWLDGEPSADNRSWQDAPGSALHYRLLGDGGPTYTWHVLEDSVTPDALGKSVAPFDGGRIYGDTPRLAWYHTFTATGGALVEHGIDQWWKETSAEPVERAKVPLGAEWVPVESPYAPVAAGVAVVGLTLTFAGLWRSDWLRRRIALLVAPLFTKLTREEVLEHRTRDEMIRFVDRSPGVGTEEIRRHLDIGWGTAVYHLSALEQSGVLTSLKTGGHRHWFPTKALDADTKRAIATLRSSAARRLYDAIQGDPGRTQQELAAELGVTHGAVIFQVRKLEHAGLIDKRRDGRFVRYFPSPERGPDGRARTA